MEEVRRLIDGDADIDERGGIDAASPLGEAAFCGHEAIVELLLAGGAEVSARDSSSVTPLHNAINQGHDSIVGLLLDNGADVSAISHGGWAPTGLPPLQPGSYAYFGETPLHCAADKGNVVVAQQLLCKGADVQSKDALFLTPLHLAASNGHTAAAQLLIDNGADVLSMTRCDGETPEDFATRHSHLEVAAMLKAEAVRRAKCEAFAMGQQERLGAGSAVQELEAGVVKMVVDRV